MVDVRGGGEAGQVVVVVGVDLDLVQDAGCRQSLHQLCAVLEVYVICTPHSTRISRLGADCRPFGWAKGVSLSCVLTARVDARRRLVARPGVEAPTRVDAGHGSLF